MRQMGKPGTPVAPRPIRFRVGSPSTLAPLIILLTLIPGLALAQSNLWTLRPLERVRNPLVGRADLGGRVFEDLDGDGLFGLDESGVPGVMVRLDDGRFAITDAFGRYFLPEIAPGQRSIALARATLPPGVLHVPPPRILELPTGALRRVDFPLTLRNEAIAIGQAEVRRHALFLTLTELPVNVIGNTTDLQALVNGARLSFPEVDVKLVGFNRGGLQDGSKAHRIAFQPLLAPRVVPGTWRLQLTDTAGKLLREVSGKGRPPHRIAFDGKASDGSAFLAPAAYNARICLEISHDERTCSPFRSFGLTTGRGRRMKRPALELPPGEALVEINSVRPRVDAEGSFISPIRLSSDDRIVRVRLQRADGRMTEAAVTLPSLSLRGPENEQKIAWGSNTGGIEAPASPGEVTVQLQLDARGVTRAEFDGANLRVDRNIATRAVTVGLGARRFELMAVGAGQRSTLYELSAVVSDTRPNGEVLIERPRVPDLQLTLPAESLPIPSPRLRVRGRTAPGNILHAGPDGETLIPVGGKGRFDAEILLPDGHLHLEVRDPSGGVGTIDRQYDVGGGGLETGAFGEAAPFGRALFSTRASDPTELRKGLSALGRGIAIYSGRGGLRLWAGAGLGSEDRPLPRSGEPRQAWGRADARLGAERRIGESLAFAASYEGAFFVGGQNTLPMRHALVGSFGLSRRSFDALVDLDTRYGTREDGSSFSLGGGGLGVRWRASEAFDLRARVGGRFSLSGGSGEVLDAALQATYRTRGGLVGSLRYSHVEDNRDVEPEAAGDVAHLTLALPLGDRLSLSATAGTWLVRGAITFLQATRIEGRLSETLDLALDFRLQSQLDLHEFVGLAEANYQPLPWLRLGLIYAYVAVTGGGEHSSRLQLRTQVVF